MSKKIFVFTDGSVHPKTKQGAWAFCTTRDSKGDTIEYSDSGYTTGEPIGRIELRAVLNSINYLVNHSVRVKYIIIYSDAQYISNAFSLGWLMGWKANNWRKSNGKPVSNVDLWERIDKAISNANRRGYKINVCWVKGHNDNFFNEFCDSLANKSRK